MAGYVALERVDRVAVHALAWHGPARAEDASAFRDRPTAAVDWLDAGQDDRLKDRPMVERLAERWANVREQWAITTFFLFDPESWR